MTTPGLQPAVPQEHSFRGLSDGHDSRWKAATDIQGAETRDAAKLPTMLRTAPQQRMIWLQCHLCGGPGTLL